MGQLGAPGRFLNVPGRCLGVLGRTWTIKKSGYPGKILACPTDTWVTWDVLRFLGVLLGGSKERLVCLGRSLGILMKCLDGLGKSFSVPGRCSDAQ